MSRAKKLSKKDIEKIFLDEKPVLNDSLTGKLNLKIYTTTIGNVVVVRDDGKGFLWNSLSDFNKFINEDDTAELNVFNMVGWLNQQSDISKLTDEARQKIAAHLKTTIDYSEQSLKLVSKIKVNNIVQEKEIFYSIILYACGYYQNKYGGTLSKQQRQDSTDFKPIVTDDKGRVFTPYWEYMKNMQEPQKVSLIESIELERIQYNLRKD